MRRGDKGYYRRTLTRLELTSLISRIANKPSDGLEPSMYLGLDLGLDSLGLVELLAEVETELGLFLDESLVSESTTVAELEALVAQGGTSRGRSRQRKWPLSRLMRLARLVTHPLVVVPLLRVLASREVEGRGHLDGLKGPAVFVCNHLSHVDGPAIYASLPWRWRQRMTAATAEIVLRERGRVQTLAAAFLFNSFPFSQTDRVRSSLEWCIELLTKGWSVLFFPEGTRSLTGFLGPFKPGAAMIAVDMAVPVVPIHVNGTFEILARRGIIPRPGHVHVRFGEPLRFSQGTSYREANRVIEEAVKALGDGA